MHDRVSQGGGFEINGGYRFRIGERFALTPKLAFQYFWIKAGKFYNLPIENIIQNYSYDAQIAGSTVLSGVQPQVSMWKLGATFEYPRATHAFSPTYYAELFVLDSQLKLSGDVTTGNVTCKLSDTYGGTGINIGAGVLLPTTRILRFSAGLSLSAIAASHRDYSDTCPRKDGTLGTVGSLDLSNGSGFYTITELTLGGDFMIGL